MGGFFTRERFGRPQFLAGLLLLGFLAQCIWLVHREAQRRALDGQELMRLQAGLRYWGKPASGGGTLPDTEIHNPHASHSRMWYLIASAPLALWPGDLRLEEPAKMICLLRAPFLLFGILLGASVWYVSRRLYGNAGGYIALTLYCFSPGMLRASTGWLAEPEIGAAWGAFGAIFTAIAVAHTLYAPREVVLWNWRRIVLLGVSLALAVGSQFSLVIVVPLALAFMWYVAPARRAAALAIWGAGCGLATLALFASYFFRAGAFWQALRHASFFDGTWQALAMPEVYRELLAQIAALSPAMVLALPLALAAYGLWPRARYFGNTAPLLVGLLFVLLGAMDPHYPGMGFRLAAAPFLIVFVAGVSADLLDSGYRSPVQACVWGLLTASAVWNVMELARIGRG
jgi:hypothetical protein